jgi:acetyl esterase
MPLDPLVKTILDQAAAQNAPPLHELAVEEARAGYRALRVLDGTPEPVAGVEDRAIPGPSGEIPVRIYTPEAATPSGALVYLHGGGWVIGDLDTHDALCRALTHRAGCLTVSVDYRLAPEHKFPAPLDDAFAATQWVADNAAALGAGGLRLAIGGDSAGGNLTAAVTLLARDRGGPALAQQVLFYPALDYAFDTESYGSNATGYMLTQDAMRWFWGHYVRNEADGANPLVSPLRAADLRGLPPALIVTAEFDPLRDEGEAYGERLREAGVATTVSRYDGMIHSFVQLAGIFPQGKEAIQQAADALRAAFAAAPVA